MSSEARLIANSANAQHSTGPRTEEGKSKAAQNSRKHGLTAKELVLAPEDREEFEAMLASYQDEIAPASPIEQTLVDELIAAAWNLRRIHRMEAELCANADSLLAILDDGTLQLKLDRLARHQARIERTFHRSLKELKALQTNRSIRATLPLIVQEGTPRIASGIAAAKRSQQLNREFDEMEARPHASVATRPISVLDRPLRAQSVIG